MVKAGFYGKKRVQRYKCQQCGERFSEPQQVPLGADVRLPKEKVLLILNCLVEGNSVRGTARLCNVEKRTVLNLLKLAGENCERLLRERVRNVHVRDLQMDEVWTFVKKKEGHKKPKEAKDNRIGDAYTFIALERHSKLIVAWHLGKRTRIHTEDFLSKVRDATADCWFQVSTDGFQPYINAIDTSLSDRVDYAQLVKVYGKVEEGREARYSPGEVLDAVPTPILGDPDPDRICTSHVERKNGTLR
jgi:transposase-like protein/IS1 family transposase